MILYFHSSRGEMRNIAQFDDSLTDREAINATYDEIRKFCDERKFVIYPCLERAIQQCDDDQI